jgi:predicted dienelactone hydrolase
MGEKTDEIERHIREQRRELGQNISELQQKVKDTVNWRAQFEQHPVAMIGIALGGGLLLSGILGSRHRNHFASQVPEQPSWNPNPRVPGATSAVPPVADEKTSESWREIKTALIAVGAMKLGSLIDSVLPGFGDEYSKVRGGNGSYSTNRS